MDFRKRLKTRLHIAIIYIILGIGMIAGVNIIKAENYFISSFGFMFLIYGVTRIGNYLKITRSDETIKKREIAETDERNIMIVHRARSITFSIYIMMSGTAVIILSLLDFQRQAQLVAYTVCALMVIYSICYFILQRKY